MRYNLVVNLFVQRALCGLPLNLHGGGHNKRPMVCITDMARAILHVSNGLKTGVHERQVYHVVERSYSIREIAEIVLSVVGDTGSTIEVTDGDQPFASYSLNSQKLIDTGFRFRWDLKAGVAEMASRLYALRG